LNLVNLQQLDQAVSSVLNGWGFTDEGDDRVKRVKRLEVSTQNVGVCFGFVESELCPANDDFNLVRNPISDELVDGEITWNAVHDREHVCAEVFLQLGLAVEVIENNLGNRVTLEDNDESLTGSTGRFIADVRNPLNLAFLDQVGDSNCQVVGVDLVRQLTYDEARAVVNLFCLDDGTHRDAAVARPIRVLDSACSQNLRTGREIGSLDVFENRVEEFLAGHGWVGQVPEGCRRDLAEIVWRDVRCHSHGNTNGSVDEEVGESAGQN
jgi:hypothetical protein